MPHGLYPTSWYSVKTTTSAAGSVPLAAPAAPIPAAPPPTMTIRWGIWLPSPAHGRGATSVDHKVWLVNYVVQVAVSRQGQSSPPTGYATVVAGQSPAAEARCAVIGGACADDRCRPHHRLGHRPEDAPTAQGGWTLARP